MEGGRPVEGEASGGKEEGARGLRWDEGDGSLWGREACGGLEEGGRDLWRVGGLWREDCGRFPGDCGGRYMEGGLWREGEGGLWRRARKACEGREGGRWGRRGAREGASSECRMLIAYDYKAVFPTLHSEFN